MSGLTDMELEEVALRRFELDWSARLDDVLVALGMGIAFSGWADFSRMSPTPMWIEHVVHKTYIKVDEQGSEAAAVAAAVLAGG